MIVGTALAEPYVPEVTPELTRVTRPELESATSPVTTTEVAEPEPLPTKIVPLAKFEVNFELNVDQSLEVRKPACEDVACNKEIIGFIGSRFETNGGSTCKVPILELNRVKSLELKSPC